MHSEIEFHRTQTQFGVAAVQLSHRIIKNSDGFFYSEIFFSRSVKLSGKLKRIRWNMVFVGRFFKRH